jgi:hypothetical protein
MANNNVNRGVDARWREGGQTPTDRFDIIAAAGTYDWFVGSAFVKSAGTVDSVGTADSSGVTGTTVIIYDSAGFPVHNIAKNTSGAKIEGTIDPNQIFVCLLDEAATAAALNQLTNLNAETATVGTTPYGALSNPGSPYSLRTLDATDLVAVGTQRQFKIQGLTDQMFDNDITAALCQLYITINPANYVG